MVRVCSRWVLEQNDADGAKYWLAAHNLFASLSSPNYLAVGTTNAILLHGNPVDANIDTSLIYGDYYFIESLKRFNDLFNQNTLTYIPAANFTGTDTFTYQACDSSGAVSSATVTVSVASSSGFINGSFESGYSGWTGSGNQVISSRASQGSNAIQFNSGQTVPNGVLSQTFATTSGQTYALSFDVGADGGTPATAQSLQVTVVGNSAVLNKRVTVFGPGDSSSLYLSTNFIFTADAAATTLTFTDVSATGLNIDLLLDNVQVSVTAKTLSLSPPENAGPIVLSLQLSDGYVTLSCQGAPGQSCEIQVSSDLIAWTPLAIVEPAAGKTLMTKQPPESCRFYRAIVQPDAGGTSN